ncbi:hypothetical protein SLA2020_318000 [Shorea laevis]
MERDAKGVLICVNIGFNAGTSNVGPGAGSLNTGPGSGSINAGSIDGGFPFGLHRMTKEEIRKYLLKWDKNGDGVLSKQEIKEALHSLGSFFPGYRAQGAMAVADKDRDGCVNMNNHEFEALIDYVYDLKVIV